MKKITLLILFISLFNISALDEGSTIKFGLLKYNGGGDWYANRDTSIPNLIDFCNQNLGMNIQAEQIEIDAASPELFNLPFIHMTGHGNVVFSDDEAKNLRTYLLAGGFLHIDDNYGMDPYVRPAMKKVFPELDFIELPFSHKIYREPYAFPNGLPKIHEHDGKAPQGFGLFHEGRLVCFYTYECDLGDGWEDAAVHNDSQTVRDNAFKMGANIIQYIFAN